MKNLDFRILIGAALVLLGGLMLLQRIGFFPGLLDVFWGVVFLAGAAFFLYRFASDPSAEWWAAIPGFALTGLAAEILVPPSLGNWHGLLFLGALGLGFFAVYASGRQRWWAIIPGGVLITLGIIAILTQKLGGQEFRPVLVRWSRHYFSLGRHPGGDALGLHSGHCAHRTRSAGGDGIRHGIQPCVAADPHRRGPAPDLAIPAEIVAVSASRPRSLLEQPAANVA